MVSVTLSAEETASGHLRYLRGTKGEAYLRSLVHIHKHGITLGRLEEIWGITGKTHNFTRPPKSQKKKIRVNRILAKRQIASNMSNVMSHLHYKHQPRMDIRILLGKMNGVSGLAQIIVDYIGGVDSHEEADKRVVADIYSVSKGRSSWLLQGLKDNKHSVTHYVWSLMQTQGVRCAQNEFIELMRSYIKHHGMFAMAMLLTMGRPKKSLRGRQAVDVTLVVEGINCGLEAIGAVATRCMRSIIHCGCKTFTRDNEEVVQASSKRRKI